jgi:hypothetical protein
LLYIYIYIFLELSEISLTDYSWKCWELENVTGTLVSNNQGFCCPVLIREAKVANQSLIILNLVLHACRVGLQTFSCMPRRKQFVSIIFVLTCNAELALKSLHSRHQIRTCDLSCVNYHLDACGACISRMWGHCVNQGRLELIYCWDMKENLTGFWIVTAQSKHQIDSKKHHNPIPAL